MSGNADANRRRARRHEHPAPPGRQRSGRSARKVPIAAPPFRDRDDYLSCLGRVVARAVDAATGDHTQEGEDAAPLRDQTPIRAGRGPNQRLRREPASRPFPAGRSKTQEVPKHDLKARFQATRRQTPAFPCPDAELANASGRPRHLMAAIVLMRCAEREDCWDDDLDRGVFAELAVTHMGVPARFTSSIVEAVRPGGELEASGLILSTEPVGSLHRGRDWGRILPITVQRFVDGQPSLLEGSRLARPGGVRPEEWFSKASSQELRARLQRVEEIRARLAGTDLTAESMLGPEGRVRIGWPNDLDDAKALAAVAAILGRTIVDGRALPGQAAPVPHEQLAATQVHRAVLLIDAENTRRQRRGRRHDLFDFTGGHEEPRCTWPEDVSVLEFVSVERDEAPPSCVVRLDPPEEVVRGACWRRGLEAVGLEALETGSLAELARRPLYPQEILRVVGATALETTEPEKAAVAMLRRADEVAGAPEKDAIVVPTTRLSQVILAPRVREEVEQALAECLDGGLAMEELRGTVHDRYGHSAAFLFVGEPGTGKTLCAEAFAGEKGCELRRGTGASLRSKWVGEAEALIEAWFRAEDDAILFLDEVDGFLKQRGGGEVAHHDERLCAVFLAELERTNHTVLMASNLEFALDEALKSRVRTIRFEAPGPVEREALWRLHLPEQMPGASDVDCAQLAKLPLTGRNIKSASYKAYLRARQAKGPVTTALVEEEARREVGLNGPPRNPLGFGAR